MTKQLLAIQARNKKMDFLIQASQGNLKPKLAKSKAQTKKKSFITTILLSVFSIAALLSGLFIGPFSLRAETITDQRTVDEQKNEDILWLARVINSETDRPEEQVLIAWVVRNRVETAFRGTTYKEVALSSHQFSGLNKSDQKYGYNISRSFGHDEEAWQKALQIAEMVYNADGALRPFPNTIRHFYSPMAVAKPSWAIGKDPSFKMVDPHTDKVRFALYDGVE